jgi:hypothetical protein
VIALKAPERLTPETISTLRAIAQDPTAWR